MILSEDEEREVEFLCDVWASRRANRRQIARCQELMRKRMGEDEKERRDVGSKDGFGIGGVQEQEKCKRVRGGSTEERRGNETVQIVAKRRNLVKRVLRFV